MFYILVKSSNSSWHCYWVAWVWVAWLWLKVLFCPRAGFRASREFVIFRSGLTCWSKDLSSCASCDGLSVWPEVIYGRSWTAAGYVVEAVVSCFVRRNSWLNRI